MKEAFGNGCLHAACLDDVAEHIAEHAHVAHRTMRASVAPSHRDATVAAADDVTRQGRTSPANLAPASWLGFSQRGYREA
jgi:hypothetical protein